MCNYPYLDKIQIKYTDIKLWVYYLVGIKQTITFVAEIKTNRILTPKKMKNMKEIKIKNFRLRRDNDNEQYSVYYTRQGIERFVGYYNGIISGSEIEIERKLTGSYVCDYAQVIGRWETAGKDIEHAREYQEWGTKIFLLRRAKGMSKYRLAKELGCTEQYLTKVERCELTPSIDRVEEILSHLGYTIKLEEVE